MGSRVPDEGPRQPPVERISDAREPRRQLLIPREVSFAYPEGILKSLDKGLRKAAGTRIQAVQPVDHFCVHHRLAKESGVPVSLQLSDPALAADAGNVDDIASETS